MINIKQGASRSGSFFAGDTSGTAVTGKVDGNWTKTIGKAGADAVAMTVTITECTRGKGRYRYTLSGTHTDTVGELSLAFEALGVVIVNLHFEVTARVTDDLPHAAYEHETGLTLLGLWRRTEAVIGGEATMNGATAVFKRPSGTACITAVQDTTAGTRAAATRTGD